MASAGVLAEFKRALKRVVYRAMRPGLADLEGRLDRIEGRLDASRDERSKYEGELNYWRAFVRGGAEHESGEPFEALFGKWTRNRIVTLGRFLGLPPAEQEGGIDDWCAQRAAIELGSGPYPTLASARKGWVRAIAVDPLARGYVEENLVPPAAERIVFLESRGEAIPLPSASADLVICENCLDHVSEPGAVVGEMLRLLRPGGHLWFFVDLSNHRDQMHPHTMNEALVRRLLGGFEEVRAVVTDHKAHPQAYGSLRGLFRKPESGARVSGAGESDAARVSVHVNGARSAQVARG